MFYDSIAIIACNTLDVVEWLLIIRIRMYSCIYCYFYDKSLSLLLSIRVVTGLSQWYPFCSVQMVEALQAALSPIFRDMSEKLMLENKIRYLSRNVFGSIMATEEDRSLVSNIASTILNGVVFNEIGILTFGGYDLPLPPINVGEFSCLWALNCKHWIKNFNK